MGVATIRQVIAEANTAEAHTGALRCYFERRLQALMARLELPEQNPIDALVEFTRKYIEYVPEFLEQVAEHARSAGLEKQVAPFLHMAEDFFLAPPGDLDGESDLHALLDEAFLAQRLIEEVNDRLLRTCGRPLVDVDMTRANIIAHHLVGEPLATRLELLVDHSLGLVGQSDDLFAGARPRGIQHQAAAELPCMSREVAVGLRLEGA